MLLSCTIAAQTSDERIRALQGPVEPVSPKLDAYLQRYPGVPPAMSHRADEIVARADAAEIAALPDNDPVLAEVYLRGGKGWSASIDVIEADMRRRGDITVSILKNRFITPLSDVTRPKIVYLIRPNAWLKPWEFMPLVRAWHDELQSYDPHGHMTDLVNFVRAWGTQDDVPMMLKIDSHNHQDLCSEFQQRLARLAKGDPFTNPNLPPFLAFRGHLGGMPGDPPPSSSIETPSQGPRTAPHRSSGHLMSAATVGNEHPFHKTTLWLSLCVALLALGALVWWLLRA